MVEKRAERLVVECEMWVRDAWSMDGKIKKTGWVIKFWDEEAWVIKGCRVRSVKSTAR